MLKALSLSTISLAYYKISSKFHYQNEDLSTTRNAICILYPDNSDVRGIVSFSQKNITTPTKIVANVRNLNPNSLHGFHIHEFGDLTEGCKSAGPHYNPFSKKHGGPLTNERHIGDMGNIKADESGNGYLAYSDAYIKLFGDVSVIGRSCVVHEKEDDLGMGNHPDSLTTGNSGKRVACGVIALSNKFKNIPPGE